MEVMTDLRPRIAKLVELSGEDLSTAMYDLKKSLLENPAAVSLMLPEDVGMLVEALRRITGQAITADATKSKSKKKEKAIQLTPEQMAEAWEDL